MARPRTTGKTFSYDDLAVAAGVTKSSIQHLAAAGLLPPGGSTPSLKRSACIGAAVDAGVPLMLAGKLIREIVTGYNQADGEAPGGLEAWVKDLLPDVRITIPGDGDDYDAHQVLFGRKHSYTQGKALYSDARLEVVDRCFVLKISRRGPYEEVLPFGWIEGWARGSEPNFKALSEVMKLGPDGMPVSNDTRRWDEMRFAQDNAVGTIRLNLSLAIRRGLDRLAQHRLAHTGQGRR
jgi:hypothetical protein